MTEILQEPVTAEKPDITGIITRNNIPADNQAETGLKIQKQLDYATPGDRPGWIPPEITYDWDTDPYAYQTEEELMPAGGPHGILLIHIAGILSDFFERKGMSLLPDTFMLYRDSQGVMQRVAPDLLLMPFRSPAPSSYSLDIEPPPQAVVEITSPKSRSEDKDDKVTLYTGLGISAYLVVDMFTSSEELREQIELHLWRKAKGRVRKIQADVEGYLPVPEMGIKTKAQGRNLIFADIKTGEILCDSGQLRQKAELEARLRKKEANLRKKETARADQETARADQETARAEQEAKLRKKETNLRKKETARADQQKQRADQQKQRADQLEAKLKELGISL